MTADPEPLPTLYQSQIHKTKYARWSDEIGRRETWPESVDRYLDFFEHLVPTSVRHELRREILGLNVMPSMRAMMTAGPALIRDNCAGYNCFAGREQYLTFSGLKSFADTAGTEQVVLAGDGTWRRAQIQSFGKQPLTEITFRPGDGRTNVRHVVRATPDHRWVTENRGEVTDLRADDVVRFNAPNEGDYPFAGDAWIAGFGFGDGTIDARGRAKVRLCGAKDLAHVERFLSRTDCSVCYPPSYGGDAVVIFHKGVFEDWKTLPRGESVAYLTGWLAGYLAADGHVREAQPGLSSQSAEAIEFVKQIAPACGYIVTGHNVLSSLETNFGTRKSALERLTLRRAGSFRVLSIEQCESEEVFCATEPVTQSFTLANGILTGNCAYLTIHRPQAFDEAMYILMCGTGVGFSVERQYVNQLPDVPDELFPSDTTIVVRDSKIGWAQSLRQLVNLLYGGVTPKWDLSKLRPSGARLKTFGGRASGPGPLEDLFRYVVETFTAAQGRKLTSIECHGIMCKVGDIVVVGGVRRSALISLSNPSDSRMRDAKTGQWSDSHPEYMLANNSAVWTEKPSVERFIEEWTALIKSKSGERGIVNRAGLQAQVARNGRRDPNHEFGTNPCAEIVLRDRQFCNLSEVVARPEDSLDDLKKKVRLAAILGTLQSTLTDFRYLSAAWKKNCEEERLLGVSITGIMDHPLLSGTAADMPREWWGGIEVFPGDKLEGVLGTLRQVAIDTNAEWAEKLGINPAAAITCVKPSGTVSQLVDSASGIHPRYAPFYIRTNRASKNDPVAQFLMSSGIPVEDEQTHPDTTWVFSYPIKAPEGSITRDQVSALDQLRLWLVYAEHWCEHKPSITVYVRDDEWLEVRAFVYRHFDKMSGVSFLPHTDHVYRQAPYREIDEATYDKLAAEMPDGLNWDELEAFETTDMTEGAQELACVAGVCDL